MKYNDDAVTVSNLSALPQDIRDQITRLHNTDKDVVMVTIDNRHRDHSESNSSNMSTMVNNKPVHLLTGYANDARVQGLAHALSARFYRNMSKCLNYPLLIFAAASSVLAGLDVNKYILLSVTLATLILSSFDHAINPKDRAHHHMVSKIEFDEIASNVRHFLGSRTHTEFELLEFSDKIMEFMTKWKSVSPPIPARFFREAYAIPRIRAHRPPKKTFVQEENISN